MLLLLLFLVIRALLFSGGAEPSRNDTPEESEANSGQAVPARPHAGDNQEISSNQFDFAGYDWNVPVYQEPSPLSLKLTPEKESWVTVIADGDTALFRTLRPGNVYHSEAKYRMVISIGDPSAVQVQLNGQPADLRDPKSGRISRVLVDQLNVRSFLALHEDSGNSDVSGTGGDKPFRHRPEAGW